MSEPFHDFVKELFAGLGPVTIKKMFGGAGVYADGVMFALLANETIYLKADASLRGELQAAGGDPFIWTPQSGPRAGEQVDMGYLSLPEDALDDPDLAAVWAGKAIAVAKAKAAAKPKKRK
ncbi:MAG: hypothetical protein GC189_00845 [Alphaproteobacteria bacterium]|nr:hypothetical protein [Alphaproteobacteria bacterium]